MYYHIKIKIFTIFIAPPCVKVLQLTEKSIKGLDRVQCELSLNFWLELFISSNLTFQKAEIQVWGYIVER